MECPSDMEQRNGRIERQGNEIPKWISIVTSQINPLTAIYSRSLRTSRNSFHRS